MPLLPNRQSSFPVRPLLFLLLTTLALPFSALANEISVEEFYQHARAGWSTLDQLEADLVFSAKLTETSHSKKRGTTETETSFFRWTRNQDSKLFQITKQKKDGPATAAIVINPDYSFVAALPENASDAWRLSSFLSNNSGTSSLSSILPFRHYLSLQTSIFTTSRSRLLDWLDDPSFVVHKISRQNQLVAVEFQVTDSLKPEKSVTIEGILYCDPQFHWALRKYQLTGSKSILTWDATSSVKSLNGFSYPSLIVEKVSGPGGSKERRLQITSVERSTKGNAAFRLSAFNLPEPPPASRLPLPQWPLLSGTLITLALVTLALWWLARKHSNHGNAPSIG